MLEFMYQQLAQFKIIDSVPRDIEERDMLVNRSLDVRSACMRYLAVNIRHEAIPLVCKTFSIPNIHELGRVMKTLTTGDDKLSDCMNDLRSSVDNYLKMVSDVHFRVSLNTHRLVERGRMLLVLSTHF